MLRTPGIEPEPPYAKKLFPAGHPVAVSVHIPLGRPQPIVPTPVPPLPIVAARAWVAGFRNDPSRKNALPKSARSRAVDTIWPAAPRADTSVTSALDPTCGIVRAGNA